MATNYKKFLYGLTLVAKNGASQNSIAGDLEFLLTDAKLYLHNGTTNSPILTENQKACVTNKELVVACVLFTDNLDSTKKLAFQLSGLTTATTRTLTIPDASGTIALSDGQQDITNKNLIDNSVFFVDDGDHTKKLAFEVSGVTTATTRTMTVPDVSGTLALLAATQTLSNKTLTSPIVNAATADTITGITGAQLLIQSATNQNLSLQAQGTGVVTLESVLIDTNTITGGASLLTLRSASNQNLQLEAQGTGAINFFANGTNYAQLSTTGRLLLNTTTDNGTDKLQLNGRLSVQRTDIATTGSITGLVAATGYIKLTGATAKTLHGIASTGYAADVTDAGLVSIYNQGAGNLTVMNQSGTEGTAANRIITNTAGNVIIATGSFISFRYDGAQDRWIQESSSVTGSSGLTGQSLNTQNIIVGNASNLSAAVDTTSTGHILANSTTALTIKNTVVTPAMMATANTNSTISYTSPFTNATTTFTLVTNQSLSLTTSGRPVLIILQSDAISFGRISAHPNGPGVDNWSGKFRIRRSGGSPGVPWSVQIGNPVGSGVFNYNDYPVGYSTVEILPAGTYTWFYEIAAGDSNSTAYTYDTQLFVMEL